MVELSSGFPLRVILLGMAVVFFVAVRTAASAEDRTTWSIADASGTVVLLGDNAARMSLRVGDEIEAGSHIRTLDDGRAVLMHGKDVITMSPNTDLAIPVDQPGFGTRLFQAVGQAIYEITKGAAPHFEVDAPFLAAVVKGTKFVVSSDASESSVRVLEGRVEVRNLGDGRSAFVNAGQIGRVRPVAGYGVHIENSEMFYGGSGNSHGTGNQHGNGGNGGGEP